MATGGTGDVLTGMIAAWLAQLLDAEAACRLAVFLHGAAGDLAEASRRAGRDDRHRPAGSMLGDALTGMMTSPAKSSAPHERDRALTALRGAKPRPLRAQLAAQLARGDVLLLSGDSRRGEDGVRARPGAGLGIDPDEVSSPTFTLVHEYRGGRLTLYHVDLYRLDARRPRTSDCDELGVARRRAGDRVAGAADAPLPGATRDHRSRSSDEDDAADHRSST